MTCDQLWATKDGGGDFNKADHCSFLVSYRQETIDALNRDRVVT